MSQSDVSFDPITDNLCLALGAKTAAMSHPPSTIHSGVSLQDLASDVRLSIH